MPSKRAVFLDRDGVVNRALVKNGRPYPPETLDEVELVPGILELVSAAHAAGFLCIVVTNQPDVARGTQTREAVDAIHARIREELPIDAFYVCDHDGPDGCDCRKPKPGLLVRAAAEHGIDLAKSFMVGDRWRDVDAGAAAGCTTIFIDYGYDESLRTTPDHTVGAANEATAIICGHSRRVG